MKLRIENLRTIVDANDIESDWLFEYLAFDNPQARFYKRHVGDTKTRLFNRITRSFPSGFVELVEKAAPQSGFDLEILDTRQQPIKRDVNADLSWLRDYQLRGVQIAAKKSRGILWLPTGCLTGDTKLIINRGGASRPYELRTVVERLAGKSTKNRNGRLCAWDLSIPTYTQSVGDDGFVRKNRIRRGWSNGIAEVFELVTETGRTIRATDGHRFWTPNGFVHLRDLRPGDCVTVTTWARTFAPKRKLFYAQQPHMWNHPFCQISNSARDGRIARVPFHRLVVEARENGLTLPDFIGRIILNEIDGLTFLDPKLWHVHHIDENSQNNSANNLEILSEREHVAHHGKTQNWKHVSGRIVPEKIKSIRPIGKEETFDLEMEAPLNNYVANEFLVHNSGKTELAVGLALAFPCKWTFLVHRTSLMLQAAERFEQRTGAPAGRIGEGCDQIERFTVATFQTLYAQIKNASARTKDPKIARLLNLIVNTEGLIVDESHVLPANSFYRVVMRMKKAYWRVGISGTPLARGDRRSLIAVGALGPVIYRVKPELLIARGLLARPDIRMLKIPTPSGKPTFQGVYGEGIVRNTARNNLVVGAAKKSAKPALIFVKEINHGKAILDRLIRAGITAEFVWGNTITPSRMNSVKRLTRGEIEVLICSVIFQEGIDIPELKSVIIATAGKSVIAAIQRVGRGMRMSAGKGGKFEVWDFYDTGNRMLERHAKERMRAYEREGYTVNVLQQIP